MQRLSTSTRATLFVGLCVLLAAAAMLGLMFAYRSEDSRLIRIDAASIQRGAPEEIAYEVESVSLDGDYLRIEGWCVLKGVSYDYYNYGNDEYHSGVYNHTHLAFIQDESIYLLPTKLLIRQDVTDRLADGIDYHFCGFVARLPQEQHRLLFEAQACLILQNPEGEQRCYPIELPQGVVSYE